MKPELLPAKSPDLTGPCGRAWRVDLDALNRNLVAKRGSAPPRELNVCAWVVHAPFSHPVWPCVAVALISLRDVPGWPPAKINLPGATHEVMVFALSPDYPVTTEDSPHYLTPANFAGQFLAASDDEALERIHQAVRDICDGTLNPDSDGRNQWAERFSRSNAKPGFGEPDFIGLGPGGMVAVGMGGQNVRNLQAIAEVGQVVRTMQADESKPQ